MIRMKLTAMDNEEIEKIIAKSPYYKATANDVDWIAKVKMQGAIQKWVDHSISVTINLPTDVKEDLVSELYHTAWKSGMQGSNRLSRRFQGWRAYHRQTRNNERKAKTPEST